MKQTKIKYQVLADDKIKIVALENVSTLGEIGKEFGAEVERIYADGRAEYHSDASGCYVYFEVSGYNLIKQGSMLEKDEFEKIVAAMKRAAQRLIEIRQKVAQYEVKEIII